MAALLRGVRLLPKQSVRRLQTVCGCQFAALSSYEDHKLRKHDQKRWDSSSGTSAFSDRLLYATPLMLQEQPWVVSSLHHKSRFLHSSTRFINLSLVNDNVIKRSFHSTVIFFKEETVVEKSLKNLKSTTPPVVKEPKPPVPPVKPSRVKALWNTIIDKWQKFLVFYREHGIRGILRHMWEELKFYKDGFKLFWKDLRICIPLSFKYLTQGRSSLTRREYRLLKQTLIDLLLMIPIVPTLIIPFMEILIPVFLWVGMVPQVFMSKEAKEGKFRAKFQRRLESAKLLVDSLNNMPLKVKSKKDGTPSTVQEFTAFMAKVKSQEVVPSTEEILKFSRLFENSLTLDDLNVKQLQGLCKLLGIGFLSDIPSSRVLRFQIDTRMRELTVDDKFILRDGLQNLTIEELQAANRARGMRALGLPEEQLRMQLENWLELHLKEKVPTSLLLLSRVMYLDETLSPAEQLKQTISALPEKTVDKVLVTSAESSGEKVDKKTKIKVLEEESKAIKKEKEQVVEEQRLAKEKLMAQLLIDKEQKDMSIQQLEEEKKRRLAELTLQKMDDQRIKAELLQRMKSEQEAKAKVAADEAAKKVVPETVVTPKPAMATAAAVKLGADIAQPIVAKPAEELVDKADKMKEAPVVDDEDDDITAKDLGDIEKAIEDQAKHFKLEMKEAPVVDDEDDDITAKDLGDIEKAIEDQAKHFKLEMEEVMEDLDDYKEDVKDIKEICSQSETERIEETLNAKILLKRMDKLVKKFDKTITQLQDEKEQLQEELELDEVALKYDMDGKRDELLKEISEKKKNLMSINDVITSLTRLQKSPVDFHMQKVLEVLDTDHDGLIDVNHVLKVTEALGRENLKLSKTQVTAMMNLVQKEAEIDKAEKLKEKEEKGKIDSGKVEEPPVTDKQAVAK